MPSYSTTVTYYKSHMRGHCDYILREANYDRADKKQELVYHKSGNIPSWATSPNDFFKEAEARERVNGRPYTGIMIALPEELTLEENVAVVDEILDELKIADNHAYTYAIHDKEAANDKSHRNIHVHIMFSERIIDKKRTEPSREDYFSRYSTNQEKEITQGLKKADWSKRHMLCHIRDVAAKVQNKHLALAGIEERVSSKSLAEQKKDAIIAGDFTQAILLNREKPKRMKPDIQYTEEGKAFIEACKRGSVTLEEILEEGDVDKKNAYLYTTQLELKKLKKELMDTVEEEWSMDDSLTPPALAFFYKEKRDLIRGLSESIKKAEEQVKSDKEIKQIVYAKLLKKEIASIDKELKEAYSHKFHLLKEAKKTRSKEDFTKVEALNKKIRTIEAQKRIMQEAYAEKEPYKEKIEKMTGKLLERRMELEKEIATLKNRRKELIQEIVSIREEYWKVERIRLAEEHRRQEMMRAMQQMLEEAKEKEETKKTLVTLREGYRILKRSILTDKEIKEKTYSLVFGKELEPMLVEGQNIEKEILTARQQGNANEINKQEEAYRQWHKKYRIEQLNCEARYGKVVDETIRKLTAINEERKENLTTMYEKRKELLQKRYSYHKKDLKEAIAKRRADRITKAATSGEQQAAGRPLPKRFQHARPIPSRGRVIHDRNKSFKPLDAMERIHTPTPEAAYHASVQREETDTERKERELLEGKKSYSIGM